MKILVVQDHLRSGGTERQAVFLANEVSRAGHEVTLLTFRPGGRLADAVLPTVRRIVLQPFDTGLDWFCPGLARKAAQLRPDVILCMGRMANCRGSSLRRAVPAASVIATMRTGKPLPWLFRRSLQRVHHVVANSREASDTLVSRYEVPPERISVIYNSLVLPPASPTAAGDDTARDALRARHGAGAATVILLCVAMFRPEKNQKELIEAVSGLPQDADAQLWLAGDGPARAACEALVSRRNLAHRVRFVGYHRDPAALYAAADIAVHASWSDALSNFVIEAQAHGLPAVVFDAQGMRECVIPERTGWVMARGDHTGFRSRLLQLMQEPADARRARAAEARAHARTTFDPARQVQAYLELFASCSQHRSP